MGVDIKAVKKEIMEKASGQSLPAVAVAQEDIVDMMLKEYFNPASKAPKDYTLTALTAAASMASTGDEITEIQVKSILDKYKP
ncbi:MAG: hypothetical protein EPN97_01090 [Alphaproteobacteria bacterium]|nr:MAG: hypothetical protein EPN97_01090 [Alphaproteobacteria bacterium]